MIQGSGRTQDHARRPRAGGFTLIELLVVIGIIALLLSMLLPVVTRVRQQALSVKCKAQMRDLGMQLRIYSEEFKGVLFPLGEEYNNPKTGEREWRTLGYEPSMPDLGRSRRWPVPLLRISDQYVNNTWDKTKPIQELEVDNPESMKCPADEMPREDHTYILNKYLARKIDTAVKLGGRVRNREGNVTPDSDVVLMGEKRTSEPDYYMEADPDSEFDRVVEPYRHGLRLGSNYLYLDGHVDTVAPKAIKDHMDSWDAIGAPIGPTPPAPKG